MVSCAIILDCSCEKKRNEEARQTEKGKATPSKRIDSDSSALPLNARLTNQDWEAFNSGDYERAISRADKCINEFLCGAERKQDQLTKENAPLPPTGQVSDGEKTAIFAMGLLNDVATCLYIKGRSLESQGKKQEAINAYKAASKFTYASCWDPQGWFWSPAEAALDRLSALK